MAPMNFSRRARLWLALALPLWGVTAFAQDNFPFVQSATFRLTFPADWKVLTVAQGTAITGPHNEAFTLMSASLGPDIPKERRASELTRMREGFLANARKFFAKS